MCLHGFSQSGQLQLAINDGQLAGNSETPASLHAVSSSGGTSPANRRAAKRTWDRRVSSRRDHCGSVGASARIVTTYGVRREPWTWATSRPGNTSTLSTWPLRA